MLEHAFDHIKEDQLKVVTFAFETNEGCFALETDASNVRLSYFLHQKPESKDTRILCPIHQFNLDKVCRPEKSRVKFSIEKSKNILGPLKLHLKVGNPNWSIWKHTLLLSPSLGGGSSC